jgi:hypothetical protein
VLAQAAISDLAVDEMLQPFERKWYFTLPFPASRDNFHNSILRISPRDLLDNSRCSSDANTIGQLWSESPDRIKALNWLVRP